MWYHLLTAVVLGALYTYVTVFVCIIPWLGTNTIAGLVLLASFGSLMGWFTICYLRAVLTDPGLIPQAWEVCTKKYRLKLY